MVTYGRGKGIVTSTGMHTEVGLIAYLLQSYEDESTPLQLKLDQLAKWLGTSCLVICGIIFVYGVLRDTNVMTVVNNGFLVYLKAEQKDIVELFMTAVSLAIAAIPGMFARGGHNLSGDRYAKDDLKTPRLDPEASGSGDTWLCDRDLFRQDRYPDPERDDCSSGLGQR